MLFPCRRTSSRVHLGSHQRLLGQMVFPSFRLILTSMESPQGLPIFFFVQPKNDFHWETSWFETDKLEPLLQGQKERLLDWLHFVQTLTLHSWLALLRKLKVWLPMRRSYKIKSKCSGLSLFCEENMAILVSRCSPNSAELWYSMLWFMMVCNICRKVENCETSSTNQIFGITKSRILFRGERSNEIFEPGLHHLCLEFGTRLQPGSVWLQLSLEFFESGSTVLCLLWCSQSYVLFPRLIWNYHVLGPKRPVKKRTLVIVNIHSKIVAGIRRSLTVPVHAVRLTRSTTAASACNRCSAAR